MLVFKLGWPFLLAAPASLAVTALFGAILALPALRVTGPYLALVTLAFGALLGAVNGVLIGYFRLRAFLTTLITLIIYRALYDLLTADYATLIAAGFPDSTCLTIRFGSPGAPIM